VTQGLAAAALVILAIRPTALFDVGFQLSFGATAAIVAVVSSALGARESVSVPAERNALLERVARYGAGLVAVSLAAQAGTAPFLAWHFGMVYPLSLFANLLVVPLATMAMWVGAVALFLCATPLFPLAGAAFGGLLQGMIWCVARLAALPLTAVAVSPAVGIWLAGVSLYVFGALLLLRRGAQDLLGGASGVLR
jgi:competence protein ComEC